MKTGVRHPFALSLQPAVSKSSLSGYSGSGYIWRFISHVLDNDDTTCASGNLHHIKFHLMTPQPLTWIRVVSNTANLTEFQLGYKRKISASFFTPCMNPRFAKVDDRTLDIACPTSNNIEELILDGLIVGGLCSLYINGGRNVALKQRAEQSSTFDGWVASNAVDGDPGVPDDYSNQRSTCSHTLLNDTSDSWQVTFSRAVEISRLQIYNRRDPNRADCCETRLVNFTLQALPRSSANSTYYRYRDPGGPAQDIYTVVPAPRISFAVGTVKIDTNLNALGVLTLCEVRVFGVSPCDEVYEIFLQSLHVRTPCGARGRIGSTVVAAGRKRRPRQVVAYGLPLVWTR
ncbi:fucolectin-related protein [Plakobranchus ocellatus]|uniref:Fucolectin-related protein n=1 Tax=Plakobranchus ocellatus TaxID=259542 RepID=A0AAV4BVA7_9GAST|nr:fucolectin-related protein [Plakobranchus ocellatus]